jgi:hypothetical protein
VVLTCPQITVSTAPELAKGSQLGAWVLRWFIEVAIHGIESTRRPGRAIRLGAIHPSSLGDAPFSLEGNLLRRKMQPTGQSLFPSQQPKVDRISHCLIPGIVRMQVIAFVVGWEHAR